jgi:hypothetical protein
LLTACGQSHDAKHFAPKAGASPRAPPPPSKLVDTFDDGKFPDYLDQMGNSARIRKRFWASRTSSKCTPAAFYPGGKVPPSFYEYPQPPEWDRYTACLKAEAERAGLANVRLAVPSDFPKTGTCYRTRIKEVSYGRYVGYDNGIGTAVALSDGASFNILHSRAGDPVRLCVVHIPENCLADDLRGIRYNVHNLRTGDRWEFYGAISLHLCWGA